MRGLRSDIPANPEPAGEAVRQAGMSAGDGETISRITLETKDRVNRLRALGNGQVPAVAAAAWHLLSGTG